MWHQGRYCSNRTRIFFRLGLQHDNLGNYYHTMFLMKHEHNWSISELEEMLPWERQIYVSLYQRRIEEENTRIDAINQQIKNQGR